MADKGIAVAETAAAEKQAGKHYLVAIAVDRYAHCASLYNCVRDAKRLINILTHKYQFSKENTFTLFDEEATEYGIIQLFKKLVPLIQPEDSLVVIYSGHGEYESDIEEGYWIPVDAPEGDSSEYISNSRIVKYIRAIQAHHTFFIVDSCFSGSLFASRSTQPTAAARLDQFASRWLLTAGRNEIVSDGKPGDHSPFADNIIYFLEKNEQPYLSVVDLIQHVITAVVSNARQTPRGEPLQDVGHRGGQFYFYQKDVKVPPVDTHTPPGETAGVRRSVPAAVSESPKRQKWLGYAAALVGLVLLVALVPRIWSKDKTGPVREEQSLSTKAVPQAHYDSLVLLGQNTLVQAKDPAAVQQASAYFTQALRVAKASALDERSAQAGLQLAQNRLTEQTAEPAPPENKAAPAPVSALTQAWRKASTSDTEADYRRFLERFPNAKQAATARERIAAKYQYRLSFQPSIKTGKQLEIRMQNGQAPYDIRITYLANNQSISRQLARRETLKLSLQSFAATQGKQMIQIDIRDANFKEAVQRLPIF